MGTIDHIYVLNYLYKKRMAEKKRKMVVMFIDMKVAFDSVDREILLEYKEKEDKKGVGGEV